MDVKEAIKTRRSIRKFKEKDIPDEVIEEILDAGRWAPSGLNNQPWKFMVIKDKEKKDGIAKFTHYSNIIKNSEILIAVFLDNEVVYNRTKDIQAIGACIQNLLLLIHSLGLGACWLGEILNKHTDVENFLEVSGNLELMAVIVLGYPGEKPGKGNRKELKEILL